MREGDKEDVQAGPHVMAALGAPQRQASLQPVSTTDRMALLHTLAFTALRLSAAQFPAFTTRLIAALSLLPEQAADAGEADVCRHAWERLNQHRTTFHTLLTDCLQEELLRAVQIAGEQGASKLQSGAMDLSLTTFDAMERKVLIDNLGQALDVTHADALAVLGLRLAYWLQVDNIDAGQNPFRSEIFLKAVSAAWDKFELNPLSHRVVLRQMQPQLFLQLGPLWQALNQEFMVRNVLPDAEDTYRRKQAERVLPPAPSLQDALQRWLAPDGMLNVIDARAIALLDKMSEQLLREPGFSPEMRQLLDRLLVPLRRIALADKDFFFNEKHPARCLMDTVVAAGLACDPEQGSADPADLAIALAIERLIARIGQEQGTSELLDEAARELESAVAPEEPQFTGKLRQSILEAAAQESQSLAHRLAESDVTSRLETGEVPGFVEIFLQTQWARALAFAYGVRDTKPEVPQNLIQAMDDLIWSMKPKSSAQERKALVERLPALLSVLNAWLNVVKWDGAEREMFFSMLAERHAAAMHAPADMTPRHQLELTLDVVQKASEHQLNRRAQEQQDVAIADFMRQVDCLAPGYWIEFIRNNGGKVNCKLLWTSASGSRLIFAGRQGRLMFTLTSEALAHALRTKRASIVAAAGVIGRTLSAALEELGGGS
jgi:hypothetical protein